MAIPRKQTYCYARLPLFYKVVYSLVAIPLPLYFEHPKVYTRHMDSLCYRQIQTSLVCERSGSVVECLTQDRGFEPHRRHCVVVLEQDTFILA